MTGIFALEEQISTEVIKFQLDDPFPKWLEESISYLYNEIKKGVIQNDTHLHYEPIVKKIEEQIFNRFGLSVGLDLNNHNYLATETPYTLSFNSILNNNLNTISLTDQDNIMFDKIYKDIIDRKKNKGIIDLEKAKVSGLFSTLKNNLYIDIFYCFKSQLTPSEVVAIILHEIGHQFNYYEYSNSLDRTNQILAYLLRELETKKGDEIYIYHLKELNSGSIINNDELKLLINDIEQKRPIFGLRLFKSVFKNIKNLTDLDKYNDTTNEQLADNFAARFGYGRQFITGMQKLEKIDKEKNSIGVFSFISNIIKKIFFTIWLIIKIYSIKYGLAFIGLTPQGILISQILKFKYITQFLVKIIWDILISGDAVRNMSYDDSKQRYKRIRNEYIELIKNSELDNNQLKIIINDIHFMDNIINNTNLPIDIYRSLANFIFPGHRKVKNDIAEQQLLETLAHNDLFLKAAQLQTLTT